ncbi:GTPase-activating protein [Puccinia graminis f. sp. tritici]|uniref:GTPase-activating protein n=1 Tax=Puccinia graminis f. sp. tritici TaxID=56615 RepID=A0A5B0RRL3_PUCGR|nr:GTPase-activating protein [Puccinia graminis f. sp. tritici]
MWAAVGSWPGLESRPDFGQSRRLEVLARKPREYLDALRLAFASGTQKLDQTIRHPIQIDVARTNPGVSLWQFQATQTSLERILYVWSVRHPASGYVQGINDLVMPFFKVFLTAYMNGEEADVGRLPAEALEAIEADSFWSLFKLLDGIQDNYIFAQPGIQRQVARMKELCERVDVNNNFLQALPTNQLKEKTTSRVFTKSSVDVALIIPRSSCSFCLQIETFPS